MLEKLIFFLPVTLETVSLKCLKLVLLASFSSYPPHPPGVFLTGEAKNTSEASQPSVELTGACGDFYIVINVQMFTMKILSVDLSIA